jgi:hypothetical protein
MHIRVKLSLCFTKHHAIMNTCWGSGGIVPHILNLGTGQRQIFSFTLQPLYLGSMKPQYPLYRRLGVLHSHSRHGGEERNSCQCSCWELNPDSPAHSIVSILSELPLLLDKNM